MNRDRYIYIYIYIYRSRREKIGPGEHYAIRAWADYHMPWSIGPQAVTQAA